MRNGLVSGTRAGFFDYADLTDNHDGATLGTEYGFSASFSLDSHPATILDMVNEFKLTLTSVCAHSNLFDPTSPVWHPAPSASFPLNPSRPPCPMKSAAIGNKAESIILKPGVDHHRTASRTRSRSWISSSGMH